jgi:rod shape-determining protein MreD
MLIWIILVSGAVFLQGAVFSPGWLQPWGVKPDLVLIVVLYAAFWKGSSRGAAVGFIGGMIEDLAVRSSGGLLGANAFAKVVTGFLFGFLRRRFSVYSAGFHVISTFLATLLSQLLFFSLMRVCGTEKSLNSRLILFGLPCYNAVIAPFVFPLLRKIVKKRYDRTKPD